MLELFIKTLIIGLAMASTILLTFGCAMLGAKVKWRNAQPFVAKVQSARTDNWYVAERYCLRGDAMYLYVRSDNGEHSWWPVERFRNACERMPNGRRRTCLRCCCLTPTHLLFRRKSLQKAQNNYII